MSAVLSLEANIRNKSGKGVARELRRNGRVPAVVYGSSIKEAISLDLDEKTITNEYLKARLTRKLVQLNIAGKKYNTVAKSVQKHPVTDKIEHVDFLAFAEGEKVRMNVYVKFTNRDKSPGIKRGGTLNVVRHEVELYCDADKVPPFIEIDLSGAKIGQSIHISHVKLPEGCSPVIVDRDFTIAALVGKGGKDDGADEAAA